jgi:uncharacterized DUF497 family protein
VRYNFEWDVRKAKENLQKHNVSFQRAATVFNDPHASSIFDDEHSVDEDRWITMGKDISGILLVVSHTFHMIDESLYNIRVISSRKVTKREANQYKE